MLLDSKLLKQIADEVNSTERKSNRMEDYERFLMFNGKTKGLIKAAIAKEFSKPETVEDLMARLIPINIFTKIITKLAGVFTERPVRSVVDGNTSDQALMEEYVDAMSLNMRMKEANRYFKMYKRNLMEIYVDNLGCPYVRNLPRHTYEVLSYSDLTPNEPSVIIKIISDDKDRQKQILSVWSDDSHWVINGAGEVQISYMADMENPDGVNPYGKMPFVYINESSYSVDPLTDDDLLRMSIAIPVILTDIVFATRFQCWSLIYTIGYNGDVAANPNSVLPMEFGPDGQRPEIGQIKPEVDTDKVIKMVQTLVALLLSTKNLSVNTVQANLDSGNVASGISKMIDSAESVEDKTDQQQYFEKAENDLWHLLSGYMIPVWRQQQRLKPELNKEFSGQFEVSIYFQDPKVMISEQEQIDISKARLDAGFSTLNMELQEIYPQMKQEQIEDLIEEIETNKAAKQDAVAEQIDGALPNNKPPMFQ